MPLYAATGALQSYVVPAGVTTLDISMAGGSGGGVGPTEGFGCLITGRLAVTPGETLWLMVGMKGRADGVDGIGVGTNGGKSEGPRPGGEGGGQSIVYQGGLARSNMRAVAGGGGGGGGNASALGIGGNGGFGAGAAGTAGSAGGNPGGAGSTTGGVGGTAGSGGLGSPGAGGADVGGRGGTGTGTAGSGGGGGGGYFGGGGGAATSVAGGTGGGGGGGSSYAGGLTNVTSLPGAGGSGDGYISISIPNQTPYAPALIYPAEAQGIDITQVNVFTWDFADPVEGDTQSAYEFRVASPPGSAFTSFGKVVTPDEFLSFAANTIGAGQAEWQVRTWDSSDVVGPWSPSRMFTAAALPTIPVITAPSAAEVIDMPSYVMTWTAPEQTAYQARRIADSGGLGVAPVYYDTGEIVSTDRSVVLPFDATGRAEHVQVRVKANGLWSYWADVLVNVDFLEPASPTLVLDALSLYARIDVDITNPTPTGGRPAVASHEVMRKVTGADDSTAVRLAVGISPGATWTDYTPASGVDYSYQVISVSVTGSRSASGWTDVPFGRFDFALYGQATYA